MINNLLMSIPQPILNALTIISLIAFVVADVGMIAFCIYCLINDVEFIEF